MKIYLATIAISKIISIFAVRHFYIHIWIGDFLCPILNYCPKYKQRFLRTYFAPKPIWKCRNLEKASAFFLYY
nr:MAG TPA: hypothetical protein [Bacteriophage sp.]